MKVEKIILSDKSKPMWTIVDETGAKVFGGGSANAFQAWNLKKHAETVLAYAKQHGVEAAKTKMGLV